ncbi:MAG: hypothetical protein ACE5H9_12120 [Anaerolineae bacterium]
MLDRILWALALSAWLVALSLLLVAWRRGQRRPRQVALGFMLLGSGLSLAALLWRSAMGHYLPLASPGEMFFGLALMMVAILVWLQRGRSPALYGGLGVGIAVLLQAAILAVPAWPPVGGEPLAVWGALARWTTLLGLAAFGNLAAFAALAALKQVGDQRPWAERLLPPGGAGVSRWLRRATMVGLALGTALLYSRLWWGWGGVQSWRMNWLWLVWLLLLAGFWLRFVWPQRRLTSNLLTIASFICALPALLVL